jgi:hypothetical protein
LIGDGNASDRYFRSCLAANVADNQYRPDPMPVYAADQVRADHQSQDGEGSCLDVPPTLLGRADEVIE